MRVRVGAEAGKGWSEGADGSRVERAFGRTWMRLDGREDVSPIVFREEGAQPLFGAVTLEIFSLGIDPVNERLIPVNAFMPALGTGSTLTGAIT